ncbi:glycosyltransferase family 2 protein [Palleronia sp.]|uniref:glycosyltransferase family 2 protein n=1 Tax=Palleronia sp. TaxID=1940284 RepID=UPI0035C84369
MVEANQDRAEKTAPSSRPVRSLPKMRRGVRLLAIVVLLPLSLPIMIGKYRARGYPISSILLKSRKHGAGPLPNARIPGRSISGETFARLESYLWSSKAEDALAILERIRARPDLSGVDYAKACRAIAVGLEAQGMYAEAVAELETIPVDTIGNSEVKSVALMKSQLHLKMGNRDEARKQTQVADVDFTCSNSRLVMSNCETEGAGKLDRISPIFVNRDISPIALVSPDDHPTFSGLAGAAKPRQSSGHGKVSVIFPIFNALDTINGAIKSILDQTYADVEVILVDDGSTDGTQERLAELADTDSRIVVLNVACNGGAYKARNFGARHASGEFVTVHDADDWSHPEKIERHLRAFDQNPGLMATGSHWVRASESLEFTSWSLGPNLVRPSYPSFMVRSRVLSELGFWDPLRFSADSEFIYRVTNAYGKNRVAWIDRDVPLAFSLVMDTSLTNRKATHVGSTRHGLRRYYHEIFKYQWRTGSAMQPSAQEDRLRLVPPEMVGRSASLNQYDLSLVGDCRSPAVVDRMLEVRRTVNGLVAVTHMPEIRENLGHPNRFCDAFFQLIDDPNVIIAHDPDEIVASHRAHLLSGA